MKLTFELNDTSEIPALIELLQKMVVTPIDSENYKRLRDLELTQRVHNCLLAGGIATIAQLQSKTFPEIQALLNPGSKGANEVKEVMQAHGLSFKPA